MSLELYIKSVSVKWCTELPASASLESPVFTLRNCACLFRFFLERNSNGLWYYNLYVEVKSGHSKWEPCKVSILAGFKKEQTFSLNVGASTVSDYGTTEIWYMEKVSLQSKLPSDYRDGNWIEFRVTFDVDEKKLLKVKKELDGKYVQTPYYMNNSLLMEEISHDFSKLFSENSHHDVMFTCGDQAITAHKSVLCCRSEVFASMLQSDMVEGKTGQVTIQDMDATIFKQFLKCLYTGCLPELTCDTAMKFYEAGDKYNVVALKKQCAEFLTDNLSPDNVYDILILADLHSDPDLKKNVLEYFVQENTPYMGDKWSDFCNGNPTLAVEVLNLFCQHLRPKST